MAQTTNDIKNGSVLNLDGQLWTVTKFQHVKPGKGPAFVRTTIKNVLSGKIVDKTFNAGMKMEFETVDNRNLQYSYEDGDNFVFMDMTTYDQIMVPKTLVGDKAKFLLEGTCCVVSFHDGHAANLPPGGMLVEHVVDLTPVIGDAAHDLNGVVGKRGLRTRLFDALSKKGQEILSLLIRLIQRVQSPFASGGTCHEA